MRGTNWTPSIIPGGDDQTVYLVAEDFGKLGRAWREADYEEHGPGNRYSGSPFRPIQ